MNWLNKCCPMSSAVVGNVTIPMLSLIQEIGSAQKVVRLVGK